MHEQRLGAWTDVQPSRIQLTADGDWDHGWVIPAFQSVSERALTDWLNAHGEHITVELFFDGLYVGVHIQALGVQERRSFVLHTLRCWARHCWVSLDDVVAAWRLPSRQPVLASAYGRPDGIDVGVVNAWQQVGPWRIWRPPEPPVDADHLMAILKRRHPALLQPQTKPLAVEVAFDHQVPHWIGINVSAEDTDGFHHLDCASAARVAHPFMVTADTA